MRFKWSKEPEDTAKMPPSVTTLDERATGTGIWPKFLSKSEATLRSPVEIADLMNHLQTAFKLSPRLRAHFLWSVPELDIFGQVDVLTH